MPTIPICTGVLATSAATTAAAKAHFRAFGLSHFMNNYHSTLSDDARAAGIVVVRWLGYRGAEARWRAD